jgi:hypothetical protein
MSKTGWFKESYRHSLAARGVKTNRYYAKKDADIAKQKFAAGLQQSDLGKKSITSVEKDIYARRRVDDFAKAALEQQSPAQLEAKAIRERDPTKRGQIKGDLMSEGLRRLGRTKAGELSVKGLKKEAQGREEGGVRGVVDVAIGKAEQLGGKIGDIGRPAEKLSPDSRARLYALAQQAIEDANKGIPVDAKTKEILQAFRTQPEARQALQQLKVAEEAERREREGFLAKDLREGKEQLLIAGADAPGDILEAGKARLSGAPGARDPGKGVNEKIDSLGQTSFVGTNVVVGNEEFGLLRPIQEPLPPLSSSFDQIAEMSKQNSESNYLFKPKKRSFADAVDVQVNQLYSSRDRLAEVDLEPFKWGTKAFETGDREGVIKAITELKREEDKIANRWALVDQTNKNVSSLNNHAALFEEPSTDNLVFQSGRGADRLADQTQKVEDVFKRLKDSNDKVFARRRMLQYRLQRLDANILPEQGAPDFDEITRFSGDEKPSKGVDWTNTPELLTKGNPGLNVFK